MNRYVFLGIIFTSSFFNAFMGAAINIALPSMSIDLSLNTDDMSWVNMSYLLSSAIFLVPFGRIADMYGRKKLYFSGNLVFIIASLLCIFSKSSSMLIGFRFIQGTGSAMIFGTTMAIIASVFPPKERGRALGMNVSAVYLGLTLAPVIGGLLTQYIGWRSIFLINFIAGFFVLLGIALKMKTEWKNEVKGKFDYNGSLLYMFAVFFIMYGFSKLPELYAILMLSAGLIAIIAFVKYEIKIKEPVLSMDLFFKNRIFLFSSLTSLINYAGTFAISFLLSLYLQYAKGLSPADAGLVLIIQPALMALVASFAGRLSDKYESGLLSSVGIAFISVGLIMFTFIEIETSYSYIVTALVFVGFGFGFFSSPNANAMMGAVEKQKLGVASAIAGTVRIFGQMFSMGVATMVLHIYLGKEKISQLNVSDFIVSAKTVFLIFSILCLTGIFFSTARIKSVVRK